MDTAKQPRFVRMTNQRRVIIEILRSTKEHPTAEWVFERARRQLPNVSLGTIYSNLRILVEQGVARELFLGEARCHYDANVEDHPHFVCVQCQRVIDLDISLASTVIADIESYGHRVTSENLQFFGVCSQCVQSEEASPRDIEVHHE